MANQSLRKLSEIPMRGTKRKIPIEKIEKKEARSVAFSKRRDGLFRKASKLCLLSGAQIAILANAPSDKSSVSFYSFGHPSVDVIVDAFLQNLSPYIAVAGDPSVVGDQAPRRERNSECLRGKNLGLGFWWEEDHFEKYENKKDLQDAIKAMLRLKNNVTLRLNTMKNQIQTTEVLASASQDFQIQRFSDAIPNNLVPIAKQNDIMRDNNDTEVAVRNSNDSLCDAEEFGRLLENFCSTATDFEDNWKINHASSSATEPNLDYLPSGADLDLYDLIKYQGPRKY